MAIDSKDNTQQAAHPVSAQVVRPLRRPGGHAVRPDAPHADVPPLGEQQPDPVVGKPHMGRSAADPLVVKPRMEPVNDDGPVPAVHKPDAQQERIVDKQLQERTERVERDEREGRDEEKRADLADLDSVSNRGKGGLVVQRKDVEQPKRVHYDDKPPAVIGAADTGAKPKEDKKSKKKRKKTKEEKRRDKRLSDHDNGRIGKKNRFHNPWPSARPSKDGLRNFLKNRYLEVASQPLSEKQLRERFTHEQGVDWNAVHNPPKADASQMTWIGHSSFLVQMDGLTILTDPVFSKRCSPYQWFGPRRYTDAAMQADDIDIPVDLCVISHSHYDHMDKKSIKRLRDRVAMWAVPLGCGRYLTKYGVPEDRVMELDWWGEFTMRSVHGDEARVVCTPSQHFSGRSLFDTNASLWSSWAVIGPTTRIWFGGDTGYRCVPKKMTLAEERRANLDVCPAFKEIGRRYGPFDVAFVPIGAYSPRYNMSHIHISPEDAVDVHIDVRARRSIACHCCTFCLSSEPMAEPTERVPVEMRARRLDPEHFMLLKIGETRLLRNVPADDPWPEPLSFADAVGGWETLDGEMPPDVPKLDEVKTSVVGSSIERHNIHERGRPDFANERDNDKLNTNSSGAAQNRSDGVNSQPKGTQDETPSGTVEMAERRSVYAGYHV